LSQVEDSTMSDEFLDLDATEVEIYELG